MVLLFGADLSSPVGVVALCLLPIDTAPGLLQALNQFLPIARASDAISHLTLVGQVGTVAADVRREQQPA